MDNDKIIRCNHCMNVFDESDVLTDDNDSDLEKCPKCLKHGALMDNFHKPERTVALKGEWQLTDVDSMQFVMKIDEYVFSVKEPVKGYFTELKALYEINSNLLHEHEELWESEWYDFKDIPVSHLDSFVHGFYKNTTEVFKIYGEHALGIFAECAFENKM